MTRQSFTERLKARIEADDDLTESSLAKKANLDDSTIRQMLKRGRSPRMETAEKICAALGTTVEEFMLDGPDEADRDIARLMSQLSVENRQKLLAYAKGLADAHNPLPGESDEVE